MSTRTEASSDEPAVQLRSVRADYGDGPVLAGVDLEVATGEVLALLGPSGCGKTTLLRTVAGFVRPMVGTVRLGGRTVAGDGRWVAPEHRNVGLVPQEGALFPHLDVGANVAFGLRGGRRLRDARVAECLELVGLPGAQRRRPGELSGGQQQRVALARALAPGPSVVLLDEPFSALDATLRSQVRQDVREALHSAGATAVLVTHDQEEALSFAQRVAVLRDGRIAQVADPVTLYQHPVDVQVGEFVGESVQLQGQVANGRVQCELGSLHLEVPPSRDGDRWRPEEGAAVLVLLRPEQVALTGQGTGAAHRGTVKDVTYFGHDALVRVVLGATGTEVLVRTHRGQLPELGDTVGVSVEGSVSVFPSGAAPGG